MFFSCVLGLRVEKGGVQRAPQLSMEARSGWGFPTHTIHGTGVWKPTFEVENGGKSSGIWTSIMYDRSWQLKYFFFKFDAESLGKWWNLRSIFFRLGKNHQLVFPRHFGQPAFGRYLDPPNIPKICSQKIFGCLRFPRCSLNEEINSDPACLYKRQLFWLVTFFVVYLNFACCSSTMVFLCSSSLNTSCFNSFVFSYSEKSPLRNIAGRTVPFSMSWGNLVQLWTVQKLRLQPHKRKKPIELTSKKHERLVG